MSNFIIIAPPRYRPIVLDIILLLSIIYSFKFRSVFLFYRCLALSASRSAVPAVVEFLFPPVTVNFGL